MQSHEPVMTMLLDEDVEPHISAEALPADEDLLLSTEDLFI